MVVVAGDPGQREVPAFRRETREFASPCLRGLFKVLAAEAFGRLRDDGRDGPLNASGLVVFAGRPCEWVAREVADRVVIGAAPAGRTVEQEDRSEAGNAVGWCAWKLEEFPCLRERGCRDDGVEVIPMDQPAVAIGLAVHDFRSGADVRMRGEGAGEPAVAEAVVPAVVRGNQGAVWFCDWGGEHGEIVAAGEAGSRAECGIPHGEELGPVVDEVAGAVASGGAATAAAAGFFEDGAGELLAGGEAGGAGGAGDTGSDDGDARWVHAGGTSLAGEGREKCALGEVRLAGRCCILMKVTMIAACGEGGVLSFRGRIPWHLPADVAHFRGACAGKALLVGRKTWLQMQGWFRDGQLPLVLTGEAGLRVPGGRSVRTVPEAVAAAASAGHGELMVLGGGETYRAALPMAEGLLLTEVHGKFPGDVFFPVLDSGDWEEVLRVHHAADAVHAWAFTIRRLVRRQLPTDKSFPISP